jgi:hypothetical protein
MVTRIETLSFRLFPLPHVSAEKVTLEHEAARITVAVADFYPELRSLLHGNISLTAIRVKEPHIRITSLVKVQELFSKPEKEKKPFCDALKLPAFSLSVEEGRVDIPFDGPLSAVNGRIPEARLTGIDLTILSRDTGLRIKGRLQSPYTGLLSTDITLDHGKEDPCAWDLALKSETLNLGAIRLVLSGLLPEDRTVRTLFGSVIRSGRLDSASFAFKGRHDQWNDIRLMKAEALAHQGEILIPSSSLVLKDLQGPLRLDGGLLTSGGLSAKLGRSSAKYGSLALGLGKNDRRFRLDTDIRADLGELPRILDAFIRKKTVRAEYSRFKNLSGTADVHLTLKDSLDHLETFVEAGNIHARAFHSTLSRDIGIDRGILSVTPENMGWTRLSGHIGPHRIFECSGTLSFAPGSPMDIFSLSGRLDSADALRFVSTFKSLRNKIAPRLTGVRGAVDIRHLAIKGPLAHPGDLTWGLSAAAKNLVIQAPDLPGPATASFENLDLVPGELRLPACSVTLNKRPFNLSLSLATPEDGPPSGRVAIRGSVDGSFRPYLKKKKWIPALVFPRLPVELSPLTLTWEGPNLALTGTFLRRDPHEGLVRTHTDIAFDKGGQKIRALTLETDRDRVTISGDIPSPGSRDSLTGRFSGSLKGKTLAALLENGDAVHGDLEGDARFEIPLYGTSAVQLNGPLTLRDALFRNGRETLTVDRLVLAGRGTRAEMKLDGLTREFRGDKNEGDFQSLTFPGIDGTLFFLPDKKARLSVSSGNVCGVDFSGDVRLPSLDMKLSFSSDRRRVMEFQELLACFGVHSTAMTGALDVKGSFSGSPSMIEKGSFTVRAKNGVVKKSTVLTKILSLIDLTELFSRNPVKHLLSTGYRYDSMDIDGTITGHNIHITRAAVRGAGINFYATGYLDLESRTMDLVVLASPFKAVDRVFYHIPIVGPFISGKNKSFLSVPVVVEGPFDDPRTRFLPKPLSAVSSGILNTFVKAFSLPFTLTYDLVTPGKKETKKKEE